LPHNHLSGEILNDIGRLVKQLDMTPSLAAMVQAAVGTDVDTSKLAVFETIMLNTKPLPGKRGSLFENAVVEPITLKEMTDSINGGNHLPLVADHELFGAPKGRLFHAALDYEDSSLTLRGLFYLDETEVVTTAKLNSGSLDEVSVAFQSRAFNCSQCGWDYFGPESTVVNLMDRVCANGHAIGVGGVHGEMVGLAQFIETSLVARGAADKPKILGKSQAKLAPPPLQVLAANGFELDELVVQASLGQKDDTMSDAAISALTAQLTTLSADKGALTANLTTAASERDAARAEVATLTAAKTTLEAQVATLTAEKAALEARPDVAVATERDEAATYLHEQLDHLMIASGKPKLEGDQRLTKVADLKAKIGELTANLTSILPVGGRSNAAADKVEPAFKPVAAFGIARRHAK